MKKFLSSLVMVILLVTLVFSLVSCNSTDSELDGLYYIDEDGNKVEVNVAATSNVDEVTKTILALSYKEVDRSNLASLLANISGTLAFSGTENEEAFNYSTTGNAKLGVIFPTVEEDETLESFVNKIKLYAGISASGTIPQAIFEEEPTTLLTSLTLNESANIYLDETAIYSKLKLSEDFNSVIANNFDVDFSELNDITSKTDLSPIVSFASLYIDSDSVNEFFEVYSTIFSKQSFASIYASVTSDDTSSTLDTSETVDETSGEVDVEAGFNYAFIKEIVEAFNIKITKTEGSVVTFSASIDSDTLIYMGIGEDEDEIQPEELDGSINISLSLDVSTMLDMSITVDASAYLKASLIHEYGEDISLNNVALSFSASISTKDTVPTISDEDKEKAEDNSDLLSKLMGII